MTISSLAGLLACADAPGSTSPHARESTPVVTAVAPAPAVQRPGAAYDAAKTERVSERKMMVDDQLVRRDITDRRVLDAMLTVPRHAFVPEAMRDLAYADSPLPIGHDATISQPYIVALMTELAAVQPGDRVLDVGTGSGYQAAILAELGVQVLAIEIVPELADSVRKRFAALGLTIDITRGDGWKGRPEHAPYDAIIVAAAPDEVPQALVDQLADGGRLVVPVGTRHAQLLRVLTRDGDRIESRTVIPVAFVPLVHGG